MLDIFLKNKDCYPLNSLNIIDIILLKQNKVFFLYAYCFNAIQKAKITNYFFESVTIIQYLIGNFS